MNCKCHDFHLIMCTKCYLYNSIYDTFTDSAIRDRVVDYFHRFGMVNDRMGSFYYPLIYTNAIFKKETLFNSKYLEFIDYLFLNKNTKEIKKLFHTSIISYIAKYDGYDTACGLDEEGLIKWSINHT